MNTELERVKLIAEAGLLAAGETVSLARLLQLFGDDEQPDLELLREALAALRDDLAGRAVELVEVGGGYRLQIRRDYAPWVSRLWEERPGHYSRALLETLALIAYRQPITRGEISDVRGVSVSTAMVKTLLERGWVKTVGFRDVPGRPALYGTTREFLDYFSLQSLSELPSLAEPRDLTLIGSELIAQGVLAPPDEETAGVGEAAEGVEGVIMEKTDGVLTETETETETESEADVATSEEPRSDPDNAVDTAFNRDAE